MAKEGYVSVKAWERSLEDLDKRLNIIEEKLNKENPFEKILKDIEEKLNKKVSVSAWNKVNEEIIGKINLKVGIKAWEKSLIDINNQFKEFALNELKEVDKRLDKTVELINNLTTHLNEKVNTAAWDRLCKSNEELIKRVDELSTNQNEFLKRLGEVESIIKEAKVSEYELKKLLESIK